MKLINLTMEKASFVLASPERTLATVERAIDILECLFRMWDKSREIRTREQTDSTQMNQKLTELTISSCLKEWWEAECLTVEFRQKVLTLLIVSWDYRLIRHYKELSLKIKPSFIKSA